MVALPGPTSQSHFVTARIDLFAPATITAYASGATSLGTDPPYGIFLQDPAGGTVSVTIIAANAAAAFSASSLGGATISSHNNTLTITGIAAQVNAALASLEVFEPAGAVSDVISLSATEAGEFVGSTAIDLQVASTFGPAFAGPPASLALAGWTLDQLPGLVIGDPQLQSLIAAGQGAQETLQLTLSVASGVLLMPNFSALSGIAATGIGSNSVELTFTGDQLAAVNVLLAALEFAGPAGQSGLAYGLRNLSGPLGTEITSGNIVLGITGNVGATRTVVTGADTLILGIETLAGGTITVSNITSDLGGIAGSSAIFIAPDAAFQMPNNTLNLGGTSIDEGELDVMALNETGTLIITGAATIGQVLNLGSSGLIDFSGTLITANQAQTAYQEALSLAAGAVLTGDGVLVAGNFSNAGRIFGPGTILAAGGATLTIGAAEIASGAHLQVGAGGVLELGPISPLFGVFDATPLTIDTGVTLSFQAENGADAVTGGLGDNLDQRGGVIVISNPDIFSGTITGFAPGDRLIFPTLTGLTLLSITSQSFVVAGVDSGGNTVEYTIDAPYPAGTTPFVYTDNEGDSEVGLRPAQTEAFLGPSLAQTGQIYAAPGIAQPVQGLDLLLRSWTTQVLSLTLSVGNGILADGAISSGATITLTAASPTALNAELAQLTYTANAGASVDGLFITSGSGLLVGFNVDIPVDVTVAACTIAGFGDAGQVAQFTGHSTNLILAPGAPGEILIAGTADFADVLNIDGLGGTALRIDAGGTGLFDGAVSAALGADVTVGDAGGPGYLAIFTENVSVAGNITIGGNAAAAGGGGEIAAAGAITLTGAFIDGSAAVSNFTNAGTLRAGNVTIGAFGAFSETGFGTAASSAFTDAGQVFLSDQSRIAVTSAAVTGSLVLGGTSTFSAATMTETGAIVVGADALLAATNFNQTAGLLSLSGILSATRVTDDAVISLTGGTMIAPAITLSGATIAGYGDIDAAASLTNIVMSAATIIATRNLEIGGNVTMNTGSTMILDTTSGLELGHAVTGGQVSFEGANAVLTIDDLAAYSAPVANMLAGDVIDLVGIAPGLVTFASGLITATDPAGHPIGQLALTAAAGQPPVSVVSDGYGGSFITLGGDMPCFARGTCILTPSGYRPVEKLRPGDHVICQDGATRPIAWKGSRTLDLPAGSTDNPVRFAVNSIAPGIPLRPVRLSPLHAVFLQGVLIPACHLVNGATIIVERPGAVTYFHLELDRHAILLADGLPAESFIENSNRGQFSTQNGRRVDCRTPCAPLVTSGPILAKIRHRLHAIALEMGYTLTYDPALRGMAAHTSIMPVLRRRRARRFASFALPPNAENLAIVATSATPADTDPSSEDRRQLAICLVPLPPTAYLGDGWLPRAPNDSGTWMQGSAEILIRQPARTLTLELAAIIQRWHAPVANGLHDRRN
jgi:hypothetical protein